MYLTAAAPAQTQAETTAQLHEKKFLPGFAEDVWETASLDSKTELAKQLAAYELAMLGVPDGTEVTVQPLDEDWLGYYSVSSRQIVLSRSVLESGTAQETMDTESTGRSLSSCEQAVKSPHRRNKPQKVKVWIRFISIRSVVL